MSHMTKDVLTSNCRIFIISFCSLARLEKILMSDHDKWFKWTFWYICQSGHGREHMCHDFQTMCLHTQCTIWHGRKEYWQHFSLSCVGERPVRHRTPVGITCSPQALNERVNAAPAEGDLKGTDICGAEKDKDAINKEELLNACKCYRLFVL